MFCFLKKRFAGLLLGYLLAPAAYAGSYVGSGFYAVDSLYFELNTAALPAGNVQVALNCFNFKRCFVPYTGGLWLYNRNNTPNTWENQQLIKAPFKDDNDNIDTLAPRGALDKINVIRVQVTSANNTVLYDTAYFIGISGSRNTAAHQLPVVCLLVDSNDAFGPQGFYGPGEGIFKPYPLGWNYELEALSSRVPLSRIEKPAIVQIIDRNNNNLLYQKCGIRVSGINSRSRPNKGMTLYARAQYGDTLFRTALIDSTERYPQIKLRAGGAGQTSGFGLNEIAEQVFEGLDIGEQPCEPVITYLNGSYWSIHFAQPKNINYGPAYIHHLNPATFSIVRPLYMPANKQLLAELKAMGLDTAKIGWVPDINKKQTMAMCLVDRGNKNLFEPVAKRLIQSIKNGASTLTYQQLDSLLDLRSWLTYIISADFGCLNHSIEHQLYVGTAPGAKMFVTLMQADHYANTDPKSNYWQQKIVQPDNDDETFTSIVIRQILLKNPQCIKQLIMLYEDLLNTHFMAWRTYGIVDDFSRKLMPEYGKYWRSWAPNSGLDSLQQADMLQKVKYFYRERPPFARQSLAQQWMPEKEYTAANASPVTIAFDLVQPGSMQVQLNSITLTKNWSGLYFPEPQLILKAIALEPRPGYRPGWQGYENSGSTISVCPMGNTTYTPVWVPER